MKSQDLKIITIFVIMIASMTTPTNALRIKRETEDKLGTSLNLTPTKLDKDKSCKTKDKKMGSCVYEALCDENHVIIPGGIIDDSELRVGDCAGQMEWCCVDGDFKGRPLNASMPSTNEELISNCKTSDNFEGICAPKDQCDKSFTPGGKIEDDELRIGSCPGRESCCPMANYMGTTSRASNGKSADCSLAKNNECPWCVALYRSGGNPNTKSASGLYCAGVVVGKRIILTSATCVVQGNNQDVWARLPNSATPLRNYTVIRVKKHTDYNSGTKENDVAVMVLDEDVVWGDDNAMGACLGFRTEMRGNCFAAGFDKNDKMVLTSLSVLAGNCSNRGVVQDASCGRANSEDTCVVSLGSPVLCHSDLGGFIPAGVARRTCRHGGAMLGSLSTVSDWTTKQLKIEGLTQKNYTISAN